MTSIVRKSPIPAALDNLFAAEFDASEFVGEQTLFAAGLPIAFVSVEVDVRRVGSMRGELYFVVGTFAARLEALRAYKRVEALGLHM